MAGLDWAGVGWVAITKFYKRGTQQPALFFQLPSDHESGGCGAVLNLTTSKYIIAGTLYSWVGGR